MGDSGISDCSMKESSDESMNDINTENSFSSKVVPHSISNPIQNISFHQSPYLSRASSTLSLATSTSASKCSSSVTVNDVRSLTANYQKMLEKATKGIKKLTIQNANLEREQDNLLTVNIDLATEAKRLVQEVKEGQIEKKV